MPSAQLTESSAPILPFQPSEAVFLKVIESAAVSMALFGGSGRLAYANRAYAGMFGYGVDECIGLTLQDLVYADDSASAAAQIEQLIQGEIDNCQTECRFRRKDGSVFWGVVSGSVVRDEGTSRSIYTTLQITDVTRLKVAEAQVSDEKEKLRITLQSISDGVICTNAKGRVTFINPTAEAMTGWRLDEALGHILSRVFPTVETPSGKPAPDLVGDCLAGGPPNTLEGDVCLQGRTGAPRYIRQSAAPVKTLGDEIIGAVLVFQDITANRLRHDELAYTAAHDGLTGLSNRMTFEVRLNEACEQARGQKREHALCLIDLDHFKAVNDSAGHAGGDALLQEVATAIRQVCRSQDFAARIGGDEFALLLVDCPIENAARVAEKVVAAIADLAFTWQGSAHYTGASIGVTAITGRANKPSELVVEADAACYAAKKSGRNRVVVSGHQRLAQSVSEAVA
jgi:diguanylate cyclase (GGDEF)-like protein/PAS domain S-box-containing protein